MNATTGMLATARGRCRGASCCAARRPASPAWRWPGLLADEARGRADGNPLAPRPPHFPAKAKRVIFLFMHGGPSQVDTFDYKPLLERDHGKPLPFAKPRVVSSADRQPAALARGSSGSTARAAPGSASCFRTSAERVDDLCIIHSMHGSNSRPRRRAARAAHRQRHLRPPQHGLVDHLRPGDREPEPARLHHHLPDADARRREQLELGLPAGRLPGHAARQRQRPGRPGHDSVHRQRRRRRASCSGCELDLLRRDEPRAPGRRPGPTRRSKAASTRSSWPSACRPTAPELQDISRRDRPATHKLYGLDDPATQNFGRQCLMARRFAERGVRFVQVTHSYKWDQHGGPEERSSPATRCEVDQPIAGLLTRPEGARPARRHAGAVGRRVRPHADRPGRRRPRPQPARLHDVAGRRRREGRASPTARPTTTATTPSRTRSTSTTCTPRSCTCSASTTRS